MNYARYTLISSFCLLASCWSAIAMDQLKVIPHPVTRLQQCLGYSARALRAELIMGAAMVEHDDVLQESVCCIDHLQQMLALYDNQQEHDHDTANIAFEIRGLLELAKHRVGLISYQIRQLPNIVQRDLIIAAMRRAHVATLLAEVQRVQNCLHTLFNILTNRDYRLVPGAVDAEGDMAIAQQIRQQLPGAMMQALWRGACGVVSGAVRQPVATYQRFAPRPFMEWMKERTAEELDNTYSRTLVGDVQTLIATTNVTIAAGKPFNEAQLLHAVYQQRMHWLLYDLAGRVRNFGFGRYNYLPPLIYDFARDLGFDGVGEDAIEALADEDTPIDKPWLIRLATKVPSRAVRCFESMILTSVQPKPEGWLSWGKWLTARVGTSFFRSCMGSRRAMNSVQRLLAGTVIHAVSPERVIEVPFSARKNAPLLTVHYDNEAPLNMAVTGGNTTTIITLWKDRQGEQGAEIVVDLKNQDLRFTQRGMPLQIGKNGDHSTITMQGQVHPLLQIERKESGPLVKILGVLRHRQLTVCQKMSVADILAKVHEYRESPVQNILFKELLYRLQVHHQWIRGQASRLHSNMQSLAERRLTNAEENVTNDGLRGTLQQLARGWAMPVLHDR